MPTLVEKEQRIAKTGKWFVVFLIICMLIRIVTYFMISENVTITRGFKIGFRLILSGGFWLLVHKMTLLTERIQFQYRNMLCFFFYMMYLLLAFASFMWTSDIAVSVLQWVMDIEQVIFVYFFWKVYLIFKYQSRFTAETDMQRILWVSIFLIMLFFTGGYFFNPEVFMRKTHGGEVERLGGFIINPNELGMLIGVGTAALCSSIRLQGFSFWRVLAWSDFLFTLILTGSRSSLIAFFGITFYFVLMSGNKWIIFLTYIGGFAAMPVVFFTVFVKEGDMDEVMSMTGRLPFWQDLLAYNFPRKPLWGFGFMRIDEGEKFDSLHSYPGAMTHNTFMQVLLNLGLSGVFIVITQMTFFFRALKREFKRNIELFHLTVGIFIPIFVNSLTEFGIWGETNYGIMFYLILIFMLFMDARRLPPKNRTINVMI